MWMMLIYKILFCVVFFAAVFMHIVFNVYGLLCFVILIG